MGDVLTYGIELGVGLACLALSLPSWRRGSWFRVMAVALAVAGVSAVTHAAIRLV